MKVKCKNYWSNLLIANSQIWKFFRFSTLEIMRYRPILQLISTNNNRTRKRAKSTQLPNKTLAVIISPNLLICWNPKPHKFKKINYLSTGRKIFCQKFINLSRLLWDHWKLMISSNKWECHYVKMTKWKLKRSHMWFVIISCHKVQYYQIQIITGTHSL